MTRLAIETRAGADGIAVRLPRAWPVFIRFRRAFRRARPAPELWTWVVSGKRASERVELFIADAETELRRRDRLAFEAAADAEWNQAERSHEA